MPLSRTFKYCQDAAVWRVEKQVLCWADRFYPELCPRGVSRLLGISRFQTARFRLTLYKRPPRDMTNVLEGYLFRNTNDKIALENPKNRTGFSKVTVMSAARSVLECWLSFKFVWGADKDGERKTSFWLRVEEVERRA